MNDALKQFWIEHPSLRKIAILSAKVTAIHTAWKVKKTEASVLKKQWKAAIVMLQQAIDDSGSGKQVLFSAQKEELGADDTLPWKDSLAPVDDTKNNVVRRFSVETARWSNESLGKT